MRILLVEDDEMVVAALRRELQPRYVVDVATDGEEAIDMAGINEYDLILLDLQLPKRPGAEVCSELRTNGEAVPILILTATDNVPDKIHLLDIGADDYMCKPFSAAELHARMRALLRRDPQPLHLSELRYEDLVLDPASRGVRRGSVEIALRRKEYDLLEYLLRNAGRVVSRQMINDHVWDMNDTIWTNAIDVHIKALRDKVDRPFGQPLIKTVHGIGYKIEGDRKGSINKRKAAT